MDIQLYRPVCQDVSVLDCAPFGQCEDWPEFYRLRLELPSWETWVPGQFVMLRPHSWEGDLTWGRPFSICTSDDAALDVFFQVVGRGTDRIAQLEHGERVTVWGPLGNGFAVEPGAPTLLLAGGIGIAPFVGYALRHPNPEDLHIIFGHRPPESCYPYAQLAQQINSESFREQGPEDLEKFIELLRERMRQYVGDGLALACGPTPFLRTVQGLALELGVRTQLCLENRMACGVGACMGCVTKRTAKTPQDAEQADAKPLLPVQVCTEGPMFWADEVELEP